MTSSFNKITDKFNINMDENSEIRHLLFTLWENKLFILIMTSVVSFISTVYIFTKTPLYEANTLIQIEDKNQDDGFHLTQLSLGSQGSNAIAYQSALIRSRVILEPIVNKLGLGIELTSRANSIFNFFSSPISTAVAVQQFKVPNHALNEQFQIKIQDNDYYDLLDKNGNLILKSKFGELAKNDDGFVALLNDQSKQTGKLLYITKRSNIGVVKRLLSKLQVDELGDNNGNKTGILQVTLRDNNPVRLAAILNEIAEAIQTRSIERKSQETLKTLNFLKEQLPIAQSSLDKAEETLNHYRASSGKIDIKIQTEQLMGQLATIEKQLFETNLNKSKMLQIYTEQYPVIIELDFKIKELEKLQSALLLQIKKLPDSDQVAMNLMRDVKVKNDLYLVLLNKIQELQVVHSGKLSDVRILANAIPPDRPLPEKVGLIYAASLILGFMLGCVMILIKKSYSHRVTDPHWVERQLGIPNLAIIPYSNVQKKKFDVKHSLEKGVSVLAESNPRDLSIEALRSLRTSFEILLNGPDKKIICFTGVCPNVGKSFISTNFAYLLANIEKRVLLIDGDIRRGNLHHYFALTQYPGLHELLDGTKTITETIKKTSIDHLKFISCGTYPDKPAELLMRNHFKEILTALKPHFDCIIIDTSPVLAATDSTIIAAMSDINFLIIGADMHQPEEIILTAKRLENAGATLHGTIFNYNSKKKSFHGNYYYQYSYYGNNPVEASSSA